MTVLHLRCICGHLDRKNKGVKENDLLNFIFHFPQKIHGVSEILVLFFENPNPEKNRRTYLIFIISVLVNREDTI
jgi:hypothetical protein